MIDPPFSLWLFSYTPHTCGIPWVTGCKSVSLKKGVKFTSTEWACSQRNESRSESRFGPRTASWLGSWFELRAFTCIANAVPITNRICALRGHILFLLRILRWLTHAWLQCAFPKCTRTNHVRKELCVHMSSESGFLCESRSKTPLFCISKCISKAWFERALRSQRVKSGFQIRKGSESRSETAFGTCFVPLWTGPLLIHTPHTCI